MSSLLVLGTVLAAVGDAADGLAETLRTSVVDPLDRALDRLLAPVDRALSPAADAFNRALGAYFGEMTGIQFGLLAATVVGLLTAGVWAPMVSGTMLRTLALASIWAVLAMSWDIQSGYTGYISFGHSALSGIAGYTTALLIVYVSPELPFVVTAILSVLATLVLGLLIALPTLRLKGPYFSLITFVSVLLFYRLTTAYDALGGIPGFNEPSVFTWDPVMRYYYMVVPMLLVALALTYLARSNLGMILVAIRENEPAVSAAGLNPTKFKIWSFVLSSIPMGLGGVLLVGFYGNVDPNTFVLVNNSIEIIAMAVLGGMSSILGPMGGAFLFEFLNHEVLGSLPRALRYVILWVLVLLVLVFARNGLFRKIWHRLGAVGGDDR
ncbi:branched-chain amino acid ABC transporter permease [Natronomonas amylolytica]|uniref:branched-chain amino acid ABC transporter permease n=1 Tax=Natronomonas amylolytica TaxID=3108498 RepID=UPI0030091533